MGIAVTTSETNSGSALLNILTLSQSLNLVVSTWTELETSLGAIARLRAMETNIPIEEREGETLVPALAWPQRGKIVLDDIVASH